jgi:hypothetical protein
LDFLAIFNNSAIPYLSKKTITIVSQEEQQIKRMTYRKTRGKFLLYPEDRFKSFWDIFITLVLLTTCVYTPLEIAFAVET